MVKWEEVGITSVIGVSVESAIVTSAASVVPFVMGVGSVSATCGTASGDGSAILCVCGSACIYLVYLARETAVSRGKLCCVVVCAPLVGAELVA